MKLLCLLYIFIFFNACLLMPAFAYNTAEALLLFPNSACALPGFSHTLEEAGVRLLEVYAENIFRGYVPEQSEKLIKQKYNAKIYRGKINYMSDFAAFGEAGMLAAANWNKHLQQEPEDAPLIVNMTMRRMGRRGAYLRLCWNNVPGAIGYKVQTSKAAEFKKISFESSIKANCFRIIPAFWPDGVNYWRIAPIFKTISSSIECGSYSKAAAFAVSKPPQMPAPPPAAPVLPKKLKLSRRLKWCEFTSCKYARMQLSITKSFEKPLADIFVDTCSYKSRGLNLEAGKQYFLRLMVSDGFSNSAFSAPVLLEEKDALLYNKR